MDKQTDLVTRTIFWLVYEETTSFNCARFFDLVEGVTTPVIQVIFNRSIGGEKNNDRITPIGIIFRRWLDGLSSAVIRLVAYLSIYRGETGTGDRVNDPLFKHFVRH